MGKQRDKIKVSAGEDLLAFIPHMVGYWPEDSIVCIGMKGKMLRATLRLDLPSDSMRDGAQLASVAAAQMACDAESDGTLVVVFGRDEWNDPEALPHTGLFFALRAALQDMGMPVRDAWYVGPEHWRNVSCADTDCCPWPGKSNSSIKESFVNAEFIFRGSLVRQNPQKQVAEIVAVRDEDFAGAVALAAQEVGEALEASGWASQPRNIAESQLEVMLAAWEDSLLSWPATPDAAMSGYLLSSLGNPTARDTILVALASSTAHALAGASALGILAETATAGTVLPSVPEPPAAVRDWLDLSNLGADIPWRAGCFYTNLLMGEVTFDGPDGQVAGPDWLRLEQAEQLLQFLAGATVEANKAPVLCLLGWIQWCKGRGTWAGEYFKAVEQYQPGYELAALLDQLLQAGHVAGCARDRRTAWRGSGGGKPEHGRSTAA